MKEAKSVYVNKIENVSFSFRHEKAYNSLAFVPFPNLANIYNSNFFYTTCINVRLEMHNSMSDRPKKEKKKRKKRRP